MKEEPLVLDNLVIGYHRRGEEIRVAGPLNETIRPGEFVCLIGRNGTGKSTLLRTLCGIIPPLSGTMRVPKHIAVVLTEKPHTKMFTVEDMVAMGRTPYTNFWGRLSAEDKKVVDAAIRRVGIEDLKDRKMGTLSDGERQKVMIAKALAQETPAILLDEPTAFLDYPSKSDLFHLLHELAHDERKVILASTHDLDQARPYADRAILLGEPFEGSVMG
ncbi:MAG: ABC transporter ATP-binding protein [Prevotellaceae bacterium]|nr:ABC transporter ATP-binding protein [Prevotellaceae bacterium]